MSEWIKNGDQIRVVIEGPAFGCDNGVRTDELARLFVEDEGLIIGDRDIVSVEKIEPPVTVFRPGDVVRDVSDYIPGQVLALTNEGYVNITLGGMVRKYGENRDRGRITSERYERVTLS